MQFFSVLTIVSCLALQVASSPLGREVQNNGDTSSYGHSHQLQPRSMGVVLKGCATPLSKGLGCLVKKGVNSVLKDPNLPLKTGNFVKDVAVKVKGSVDQNKANQQYSNLPLCKGATHCLSKMVENTRHVDGKNKRVNFASKANQLYNKDSSFKP
ncbi:hypothetical protein DSO57_1001864 [Entomophthora muscae]|uniref:Uncharacterized protein n=1 Tax=Entomophthora muscae TaxID=34485 RepID=A0ACC2TK71_9FUNG|nr:hypothetical protein DSO57_1001864 [Entomophthora muscae]